MIGPDAPIDVLDALIFLGVIVLAWLLWWKVCRQQ